MFCDDRINVQKQEWPTIQTFLETEPYRLPKDQPDPRNRKLSEIGIPQLAAYFKEREGRKKTRVGRGNGKV